MYFPTGASAEEFYSNQNDVNIIFIDRTNKDSLKTREFLPSYLDYIYNNLRATMDYCNLLNNVGINKINFGERNKAKSVLKESIAFIPDGANFVNPYKALEDIK